MNDKNDKKEYPPFLTVILSKLPIQCTTPWRLPYESELRLLILRLYAIGNILCFMLDLPANPDMMNLES